MPNTTAYSFGDVVLVPFPFTDQTASKKRPAVVVSADAYHQRRPDVIVMAVTSQILRPAGALGEVLISDWQGAGLPKASLIKPVLATIEQRLILRKLGSPSGRGCSGPSLGAAASPGIVRRCGLPAPVRDTPVPPLRRQKWLSLTGKSS
jgi:mRNA interferase MazF